MKQKVTAESAPWAGSRGRPRLSAHGARRTVKLALEGTFGVRIFRELPTGVDLSYDMKRLLPNTVVRTIFDVGANVGNTVTYFMSQFARPCLFAFEPHPPAFEVLTSRFAHRPNVSCFSIAFGSSVGREKLTSDRGLTLNRLVSETQTYPGTTEEVIVETVDTFCVDRGITKVDLLKIDTEGSDLDVLIGAGTMLSTSSIGIVYLEVGMNAKNDVHVPFETVHEFLLSKHYEIFGIYEQINEWPNGQPHLRRANIAFVSENTIRCNSICV
jgi:FkbM family methyltransferase